MSWYYTEPRPRRRPLDPPAGTTTGGGGGPPTGPAGGDLSGSYPNPTIAAGAVGDAEIVSVAWAKVTGAPSTFPPSGSAGGDLSGSYPDPQIGLGKVTAQNIAAGGVARGNLTAQLSATIPPQLSGAEGNKLVAVNAGGTAVGYVDPPTVPTTLPPSGPAGGDLVGTYPNPDIKALAVGTAELAAGAVTDAKVTDVAYGKVTGAPTSLPPSGAASGDLAGTYPAPTIGPLKVTDAKINDLAATKLTGTIAQARLPTAPSGLLTANLNDAQVTNAKISDVAWGKVTGAPSSFPPSGTASGDLTGSYPGPTIAAGAVTTTKLGDAPNGVTTAKLNDSAVTNAKIADVAWTKVTGAPTSFPPSGTAGGDLTGIYPNPTLAAGAVSTADLADAPSGVSTAKLNDGAVTNAKIADVAWGKVTGAPTSFPPSGTAGGDLAGSYPNPAVDGINGAAVGTTTPLARGDLLVANATPALVRLARGTVNQVLQSNGTDVVWGPAPATGGPPTGAAGGSLAGSYPNPTLATTGVTAATYGTQYKVAQVTVNAEGRITAVVEVLIRARWG